jgi:hypothetical protein
MVFRFLAFVALAAPVASQTACTLCPDGNDPVLPTEGQMAEVCPQVIALLPSMNADGCASFQQGDYPKLCGCFPETPFTCDVCPNGGEPNPFGYENIQTCEKIKFAAAFATSSEDCTAQLLPYAERTDIQTVCGCPGTPVPCTVCPDGSAVGNPTKAVGMVDTCEGYDFFLHSFANDSPECAGKSESGMQFYCECPGVGEGKACSICAGGAQRGEPRDPALFDYCKNADNKALFLPVDSCDDYTDSYDQWACGCPDAVPACNLCEDGSEVALTTPSDFTRVGATCAFDQFSLKYIVDLDCPAAQGTVGKFCGCSNPVADGITCDICGDGIPLPDPTIFVESFGHTCGFIEYFATSEANAGSKTCTFTGVSTSTYAAKGALTPTSELRLPSDFPLLAP